MVENQRLATTDEIKCAWCNEYLFRERIDKKIVMITIERDEDGASAHTKFWAHEDCLPEDLAS